ncbi:hypothetical protein LMG33818_000885 [Halomonadaceae bacterium LMG 33818]|uniref:hypothetical protein n=1 Tax=Cernens ardua TaxID=3402176 RepID=UPI003EDBD6F4
MALKLSAIPTFNKDGHEWVEIKLSDDESFKLLVGSTYSSEFRSAQASLSRHINAVSAGEFIGSKDFSIEKASQDGLVEDDLLRSLVAKCLVSDWVGIVDDNDQPVPYTPEKCEELLLAYPDVFNKVVSAGRQLAQKKAEQVADTVEK